MRPTQNTRCFFQGIVGKTWFSMPFFVEGIWSRGYNCATYKEPPEIHCDPRVNRVFRPPCQAKLGPGGLVLDGQAGSLQDGSLDLFWVRGWGLGVGGFGEGGLETSLLDQY